MADGTRETGRDEAVAAARGGSRVTRRGLLALVGASAVAGCSALGVPAGGEPTIRSYDLPDIDRGADPEPVVPPAVPVDVAPAHFDGVRDRVTALLSELPTPMGPAEIPNGHVRQHLADAADEATDGLDDARGAPTELLALRSLRHARGDARYAAAGWAVADRGLSAEAVRREHGRAVSKARSARADHEYVGADPVRATLVHAVVETTLERAIDGGPVHARGQGRLLTVAEWGEAAESARAGVADARHLAEQFTASLPADAGTVGATLAGAAEELFAAVRSGRSDLPPEPTADDWGVAERAVHELRREAEGGPARAADAIGPASAVVDANRRLTGLRALDRVEERIDAGEVSRAGSAEAVREVRAAAYDALEGALGESPAPGVARTVVADAAWRVANADRELARHEGEIAPASLDDVVADYVVGAAIARAAPAASRRTADALTG